MSPAQRMEQLDPKMKDCIDTCTECAESCLQTIPHCLSMGGEHAEPRHIALLQVCADICQTSARAMLLNSDQHKYICEACAQICDACAEECDSMDGDFMKDCARICRECATSCKEMASMGHKQRTQSSSKDTSASMQ